MTLLCDKARADCAAGLISAITNPTILSVLFLLATAWLMAENTADFLRWGAVLAGFLALLPLGYVYIRFYSGRRRGANPTGPTRILKYHPFDILFLSAAFGLPCLLVLRALDAPLFLLTALTALLLCSTVVAVINIFNRVSFHLASLTVLIILISAMWGWGLLGLLAVLPAVGWAKHHLGEHNVFQLVSGTVLAGGIGAGVLFYGGI